MNYFSKEELIELRDTKKIRRLEISKDGLVTESNTLSTPIELKCELFEISRATYYRYKKTNEPVLYLINYFSKEELIELRDTKKIGRLENLNNNIFTNLNTDSLLSVNINPILKKKATEKANEFGFSLNQYLEHLIVNDISKSPSDKIDEQFDKAQEALKQTSPPER